MKRFWHSWMAVIATVAMISPAAAQNDLGQLSEIGSYQSILSRAGYPSSGYGSSTGRAGGDFEIPSSAATNPSTTGGYYNQNVVNPTGLPDRQVVDQLVPPVPGEDPVVGESAGNSFIGIDNGSNQPVYDPGCDVGTGRGSNIVFGVRGLLFDRNYENNRAFSENTTGGSLFAGDTHQGTLEGIDITLQSRNGNNRGWEIRYFGIYPGTTTANLAGAPVFATNNFDGFDQLNHVASGSDVWSIFNDGTLQTIERVMEINNLEFNVLRNGGRFDTWRGSADIEISAGFRWFQFDESLGFSTATNVAGFPPNLTYTADVENTLLGFQVGGRSEYCLTRRLRLNIGSKLGVYNNNVSASQSVFDNAGAYAQIGGAGPNAGQDYAIGDEKNDVAFLGELDLGLSCQMTCNSRFVFGYRALGVSGVALADGQIPSDYSNISQIGRTNSNSSLMLGGGYFGFEFSH